MALWFCSSAIETTFPLFNFKTKHIFVILMALRKPQDHLGRRRRPKKKLCVFLYSRRRWRFPPMMPYIWAAPIFSFLNRNAAEGVGFPNGHQRQCSPGGRGKRSRRRLFCQWYVNNLTNGVILSIRIFALTTQTNLISKLYKNKIYRFNTSRCFLNFLIIIISLREFVTKL